MPGIVLVIADFQALPSIFAVKADNQSLRPDWTCKIARVARRIVRLAVDRGFVPSLGSLVILLWRRPWSWT